jgi:hypothetical protein
MNATSRRGQLRQAIAGVGTLARPNLDKPADNLAASRWASIPRPLLTHQRLELRTPN